MATGKGKREYTPEFRITIAEQMLAGTNVTALSRQHHLARSLMYRWRDALRKQGAAGLQGPPGRPALGPPGTERVTTGEALEEQLRRQVAELQRKVGQQAVAIDFFKGVFKRLGARPKTQPRGAGKSTPRSDG